jgi:hypothetical protein
MPFAVETKPPSLEGRSAWDKGFVLPQPIQNFGQHIADQDVPRVTGASPRFYTEASLHEKTTPLHE